MAVVPSTVSACWRGRGLRQPEPGQTSSRCRGRTVAGPGRRDPRMQLLELRFGPGGAQSGSEPSTSYMPSASHVDLRLCVQVTVFSLARAATASRVRGVYEYECAPGQHFLIKQALRTGPRPTPQPFSPSRAAAICWKHPAGAAPRNGQHLLLPRIALDRAPRSRGSYDGARTRQAVEPGRRRPSCGRSCSVKLTHVDLVVEVGERSMNNDRGGGRSRSRERVASERATCSGCSVRRSRQLRGAGDDNRIAPQDGHCEWFAVDTCAG